MTRHFFALFALITGIAALSGPANANLAEALSCDVGVSADAGENAGGEIAARETTVSKRPSRDGAYKPTDRHEPGTPLRLPVLMGIERAYE